MIISGEIAGIEFADALESSVKLGLETQGIAFIEGLLLDTCAFALVCEWLEVCTLLVKAFSMAFSRYRLDVDSSILLHGTAISVIHRCSGPWVSALLLKCRLVWKWLSISPRHVIWKKRCVWGSVTIEINRYLPLWDGGHL